MKLFTFLAFILYFFTSFYYGENTPLTYKRYHPDFPKDFSQLLVYKNFILSSQDQSIQQWRLNNKLQWNYQFNESISEFHVHFSRLITKLKSGKLVAYKLTDNSLAWSNSDYHYLKIYVSYPFIFYKTSKGSSGLIDFYTGNTLWNTKRKFNEVSPIGRTEFIAALYQDYLALLSLSNGTILERHKVPSKNLIFLSNWNNGLLLKDKKKNIYKFDTKEKLFSKVAINSKFDILTINRQRLIFFDNELSQLILFNTDSLKNEWTIKLKEKPKYTLYKNNLIIVIFNDEKFSIYQVYPKAILAKELSYQSRNVGKILDIFEDQTTLFIIAEKQFITLKKI